MAEPTQPGPERAAELDNELWGLSTRFERRVPSAALMSLRLLCRVIPATLHDLHQKKRHA